MSAPLQEGSVFAARYKILRCIAAGGMGAVYEVIHLETERRRALKVMLPHVLQSADLRERFKREARVAAQIESDFIVDVFDAGIDEATEMPFLVMELLRGEELGKRLKRLGRLLSADVVLYLRHTALALDKTHKASIVHRDLKPENLFLTERDDGAPLIKVLDFGVAKLIAEGTTNAGATQSVGTPMYMAPEQFRSETGISAAVDIYALGMMAYTLLVGQPYWAKEAKREGNIFAFAAAAMNGPVQPACARAAERGVILPPGFDAWFATATAVDRRQRFSTATMAVNALAQLLDASVVDSSRSPGVDAGRLLPSTATPAQMAALTPAPSSLSSDRAGASPSRSRSPLVVGAAVAVGAAVLAVISAVYVVSTTGRSSVVAGGAEQVAAVSLSAPVSAVASPESPPSISASASVTPPPPLPVATMAALDKPAGTPPKAISKPTPTASARVTPAPPGAPSPRPANTIYKRD